MYTGSSPQALSSEGFRTFQSLDPHNIFERLVGPSGIPQALTVAGIHRPEGLMPLRHIQNIFGVDADRARRMTLLAQTRYPERPEEEESQEVETSNEEVGNADGSSGGTSSDASEEGDSDEVRELVPSMSKDGLQDKLEKPPTFRRSSVSIPSSNVFEALASKTYSMMDLLAFDRESNPKSVRNEKNRRKLLAACATGHASIVAKILEEPELPLRDLRDPVQRTPVHIALLKGHVQTVLTLLLSRRFDLSAKDTNGKTPLDLAQAMGPREQAIFVPLIQRFLSRPPPRPSAPAQKPPVPLHQQSKKSVFRRP